MRDADGPVAGNQPFAVKRPVALEGVAMSVEFPAVELDDQASRRPEAVDLVAEDEDIGGRGGRRRASRKAWKRSSSGERVVVGARSSESRRRIGFKARRPRPRSTTPSSSASRNRLSRSASSATRFRRW
jgi:hypothetical protein